MLVLVLAACGGGAESGDLFEDSVAADSADLARVASDVSAAGAQVPDEVDATASQCFDTWGGCSLCFDLAGGPLAGTYDAALDGGPCEASRTGRAGTVTYRVTGFDLAGDWAGAAQGDYTISATGTRTAELLRDGARRDRGLDATFTIDALEATTEAFELTAIAADVTYEGFANHTWDVHFEGTPDSISGEATGDHGRTCSIVGPLDDLAVVCE